MSTALLPADQARFASAEALLQSGRVGEAISALEMFLNGRPGFAPAHYLHGIALQRAGDQTGAEHAYRVTLALDPKFANAAVRLAMNLNARREASESVELLAPFVETPAADLALLTAFAVALKILGRTIEATNIYQRAVEVAATSGLAEHNLAGIHGDCQRFAQSEAAARRAFDKGLDAPETWLVLGRALQGQGDFAGAENAYREALNRRSEYGDAHAELAQLIWMQTEDVTAALRSLDAALEVNPANSDLCLAKARFLEYASDSQAALSALANPLQRPNPDPVILLTAAYLAISKDPRMALALAERATAAAPKSAPAKTALCQANLGLGRAEVAAVIAEELCAAWPLDQFPVALLGTAWRLLGDPRYFELYDYERLVRPYAIDTPLGWSTLDAYLRDLSTALISMQQLRGHPIGQSLRQGAQSSQSLALSGEPVIKAFFAAIDSPIRAYIAHISKRNDLLGRRARDDYRFSGAWSALLRPGGGHHVNHLHPMGWISSAFHIQLPDSIDHGHEGWLKFGEPGMVTDPLLGPEHFVKPRAGTLVLFPSYMWHGTVPFVGSESRLTLAFDALPN